MKKTIRSHTAVWFLQVQAGYQDTEAAIEAGNQAPISGGPSDEAAAGEVLAATLSFTPGCRVMEARDQG